MYRNTSSNHCTVGMGSPRARFRRKKGALGAKAPPPKL